MTTFGLYSNMNDHNRGAKDTPVVTGMSKAVKSETTWSSKNGCVTIVIEKNSKTSWQEIMVESMSAPSITSAMIRNRAVG